MENSYGLEFESKNEGPIMIDPRTLRPTTVSIVSQYCHTKVLVGGHPDGVKFLLTNKKHHGITSGFVIKGQPALNTAHYSHAYETLTRLTEGIQASEGHIPG